MLLLEDVWARYLVPSLRPYWKIALRGVNLELGEGKFAIMGPNGAGKTTLFKVMSGIMKPFKGRIRGGRVFWVDTVPSRPRRVKTFLRMFSILFGKDWRDYALADYNYGTRLLTELSAGERRMVKLTVGLMAEPDYLLLDEPENHLDPEARARLLKMLHELPSSVIVATHNPDFASRFADRIYFMKNGKILGMTEDLPELLALELDEPREGLLGYYVGGKYRVVGEKEEILDLAEETGTVPERATAEDAFVYVKGRA